MVRALPLTGWQKHLIAIETQNGTSADFVRHLTLCSAIRIQPGVDERRLRRAFDKLCKRHDIIRSRYSSIRGKRVWTIQDQHPIGLMVHDHASVTEDKIPLIVQKLALTPITVEDEVLSRLDLLNFGALGDVLMIRAHLSIVDGYGLIVAAEDMIGLLIGLPLLRPALSAEEYMQTWGRDRHPKPEQAEAYWRTKLLPPPPPVNMGRPQKGMPLLSEGKVWQRAKDLVLTLDASQEEALEAQAQKDNLSLFAMGSAALMKGLSETTGTEDFLYGLTLARSDGKIGNFAGSHTLHPVMRCRGPHRKSLIEIAQDTTAELVKTIAHLPFPAGRKGGEWDNRIIEAGGYPHQVMIGSNVPRGRIQASSYLSHTAGRMEGTHKLGKYSISPMSLPSFPGGMSEFTFRINTTGKGGSISFKYDAEAYSDKEIEQLATRTLDKLQIEPKNQTIVE